MMLRHLGEDAAAASVERAIENVLREGTALTADLGGQENTVEARTAVADAVRL
jgi:isocitrate/isopropylmalate dehydrogenase